MRQQADVDWAALIRKRVKAGRRRGASWVRVLDVVRLLPTSEGRARLWTRIAHWGEVHQTTPFTAEDRYPELFDLAAGLAPHAGRILSFGCSTGEELVALRRRFPDAEIVGAEINPRSRRLAARRVAEDLRIRVEVPTRIDGVFDLIFALAVFQREPYKIDEIEAQDISSHYPFARFDAAVGDLVARLRPGGLLCVANAQYRIEDSSAAAALKPVVDAPRASGSMFGRDGTKLDRPTSSMIFRKRG